MSGGQARFYYIGNNVGQDVVTIGPSWTETQATATRTWYRADADIASTTPARVVFDDPYMDVATGSYWVHGFWVYNAAGAKVQSNAAFTATVAGVNGPRTFEGNLRSGRGDFGYTGSMTGIDELVVTVEGVSGSATRSFGVSNTSQPAPVPTPEPAPSPTVPPTGSLPSEMDPDTVATRAVWDYEAYDKGVGESTYNAFTFYNADGNPVRAAGQQWYVTVQGANGPQTFTGYVQSDGRGAFGYNGYNRGTDLLTVTMGAASSVATRTFGGDLPGVPGPPDVPPVTPPMDPDAVATTVVFDQRHYDSAVGHHGYHGFTFYNSSGARVKDVGQKWTATVAGSNGPLTFTGGLVDNGRGVFSYYGNTAGIDLLSVTMGGAADVATRSYGATATIEPPPTVDPPPAGSTAKLTPSTSLQIWDMNMNQLQQPEWKGAISRLATNPFLPDIILLQDLANCDRFGDRGSVDFEEEFMRELRRQLGYRWDFAHAQEPMVRDCTTGQRRNAVVWNMDRLYAPSPTTQVFAGLPSCTTSDLPVAIKLRDKLTQRDVVAASVHINADASADSGKGCLATAMSSIDAWLDNTFPVRDMVIFAGDVNERPQRENTNLLPSGEPATNGLETDPLCWYRGFSTPHPNFRLASPTQQCSSSYTNSDTYYDAVWLHAGSGGGTNPTATSFCQQFTHIEDIDLYGGPTLSDAANSCTNIEGNSALDRSRIDYIWVNWQRPGGYGSGSDWLPAQPLAASFVEYASADTGIDLTDSLRDYSDHRAVQALITWPPEELMLDPARL